MNAVNLQLLNMMPLWLMNYSNTMLTIYSCTKKNKNFKWAAIAVGFKMLFINVLNVYLIEIYEENKWVRHLSIWSEFFSIFFSLFMYKFLLQPSWEKVSVVFIIADIRTFFCWYIPFLAVSILLHYNVLEHIQNEPTIYNVLVIIFTFFNMFMVQKAGKGVWEHIKRDNLKYPKFWRCALFLFIVGGTYSTCYSGVLSYPFDEAFIIYFLVFLFLFFLYKKNKERLLQANNRNLMLQQEMILQYYESLTEQIDLTRKMKHDIDNHMQIIRSIQDKNHIEELDLYTKDLKEQYDRLSNDYYCSNVIINALVANKKKKCEKEKIDFKIDLNEMELGNISEYDFVSILFNLLDNAIESCVKIADETGRFICLNCFTDAGQLIIYMKNGCNDELPKSRPQFFTTKQDKRLHGVGMYIIEEMIEKYNGNITTKQDSLCFETTVNLSVVS